VFEEFMLVSKRLFNDGCVVQLPHLLSKSQHLIQHCSSRIFLGQRYLGIYKKIFLVAFVAIAVGFVIINTNALSLLGKPINLGLIAEQAVILKVSFDNSNNNTLFINVHSMYSQTIVFNTAVIKNSQHDTVATIVSFHNELPAQKNVVVSVDISGIILSSGNYTVDLWTTKSHHFSSPSFIIK
jgi:hypothetical protein